MRCAALAAVAGCWTAPVPAPAVAEPPRAPVVETIVRDAPGAFNVNLDARHLYWVGGEQGAEGVWRADKIPGAQPRRLASTQDARGLTVDGDRLWWADGTEVRWVPVDGGTPVTFSTTGASVLDITRDRDELVTATTDVTSRGTKLTRYAIADGSERGSVTVAGVSPIILATSDGVYAATSGGLFRLRHDGGLDTMTRDGVDTLSVEHAPAGRDSVWFGSGGDIFHARGSGPSSRIARGPGESSDIAADERYVYWGAAQLDDSGGAIFRAPKTGGRAHLVVHVDGRPGAVIVDGDYLYWCDREPGAILRRRRD